MINELRIGNYIQYEDDPLVETVEGIHYFPEGYKILIGNYLRPIEQCESVLLTCEILERLGFTTIGNSKDYRLKNVIVHYRRRGFVIKKSMPTVFAVHQLQNIYFALTGEELLKKQ